MGSSPIVGTMSYLIDRLLSGEKYPLDDTVSCLSSEADLIDGRWSYPDQKGIDQFHCFSIFTMYWPQISFYALIGKE